LGEHGGNVPGGVEFVDLLASHTDIALVGLTGLIASVIIGPGQTVQRRSHIAGLVPRRVVAFATDAVYKVFGVHDRVYVWIAGVHPQRRLWHFQWLSVKDLYDDLQRVLPTLRGNVLDVGCWGKPYALWLTGASSHIGIDITKGEKVDYLIREGEPWPLESGSMQCVLCTQVLEVARDVPHIVSEIDRVLEPGGIAVVSTPFFYNDTSLEIERGIYKDLWRHSFYGAQVLFAGRFSIVEARRQGGFGSTMGLMLLNWIAISMSRSGWRQLLMVAMLPLWLPFCLFVNAVGWLIDKADRTGLFYHNVFLVLRKKEL
jgi:SAM-dependent methyltransferase